MLREGIEHRSRRPIRARLAVFFVVLLTVAVAGCSETETSGDSGVQEKAGNVKAKKQDRPGRSAAPRPNKPRTQPNPKPKKQAKRPVALVMLKKLRVRPENRTPYSRDHFKHWTGGSCDTRKRVLSRENRKGTGSSCDAYTGMWYSPYDSVKTTDPSSFDIDHVVPLAEAWRSGASRWTSERREKFANDMHAYSLIAVTASSNRQKGDRDPSEWLPDNRAFVCSYVARWIAVKFRWRLSVDRAEKAALAATTRSCPNRKLKLTKKVSITGKPAIVNPPPASKPSSRPSPKPKPRKKGRGGKGRKSDPIFDTCTEAKAHGYGPYYQGTDPEYDHYIDRDSDGIVCE